MFIPTDKEIAAVHDEYMTAFESSDEARKRNAIDRFKAMRELLEQNYRVAMIEETERPAYGDGDGCSGFMSWGWRKLFSMAPPWEGCCDEHDMLYKEGGTKAGRRIADAKLRDCVRLRGVAATLPLRDRGNVFRAWAVLLAYRAVAWAMWAAVRIGGHPLLPLPWRWGYGLPYFAPYKADGGFIDKRK